ncbi:hypothetical protein CAPTEDRAFT_212818 [Capitella teleta]|uniref:Fibronectin type-III domain-containing protein n=1 Tax=Capitella teleta TaxID=283909 RepID=R7UWC3_CAPTE|nr:hypothetical protein CAPTEDRAFT_212818 [Capitella teleta]|eukprot:ELU07671.1 hypothetical protein CAPTEDRAFT_212818 [Capitella teleta]
MPRSLIASLKQSSPSFSDGHKSPRSSHISRHMLDNKHLVWRRKFQDFCLLMSAECPEPPTNVQLSVSSSSSLLVHFNEQNHHNGAVVTRYKVEWSCFEDFSVIAGEQVIDDPRCLQYEIPDLVQGNCYYVRVSAWDVKGFGDPCPSCPVSATPSNWREVSGLPPRCEGKLNLLDGVFVGLQEIKTKEGVGKRKF